MGIVDSKARLTLLSYLGPPSHSPIVPKTGRYTAEDNTSRKIQDGTQQRENTSREIRDGTDHVLQQVSPALFKICLFVNLLENMLTLF